MFFDIRQSTRLAEILGPDKFAATLGILFTDIMDLIHGYGGSVNKMLGDGIMATFGCPEAGHEDALDAVRCAEAIRKHLGYFNQMRPKSLRDPIEAGIGIATGKVFAGNIGSVVRLEYAVLGDPVNLASRLESLTKLADKDILIDGNTLDEIADNVVAEKVEFKHVRGKIREVRIFSIGSTLE